MTAAPTGFVGYVKYQVVCAHVVQTVWSVPHVASTSAALSRSETPPRLWPEMSMPRTGRAASRCCPARAAAGAASRQTAVRAASLNIRANATGGAFEEILEKVVGQFGFHHAVVYPLA